MESFVDTMTLLNGAAMTSSSAPLESTTFILEDDPPTVSLDYRKGNSQTEIKIEQVCIIIIIIV